MALAASIALAATAALRGDTTVVLGTAERDLTGDGRPESLRLVGVGASADNLTLTFTVEDGGRTIYRAGVHLPSRTEYERRLRGILRMEYRDWLKDVGSSFFAEVKFQKPRAFLTGMRESVPGRISEIPDLVARQRSVKDSLTGSDIWNEIQDSGVTLFEYSPGGDGVTAIGWSRRDGRFYRLFECC